MGSGIYNIGVSALRAAQAGISVTSHNIANANTPGYTRQEIIQTAMLPQNTGAGFFGQGADVTNVIRRYDQFLSSQVLEAQTRSSNLTAQYDLAQQVSNLLGDSTGGLSPTLQDFFGSVNEVANAPESVAARQTLLGSAQSLVNRLQTLDGRMNEIRDDLNGQISESVSQINSYARQIATLNDTIVQMQAQTPGQAPNDLLDQRDYLVNQLSQEVRVSTIKQPDGSMDVFIGSGQSLVVGNRTSTLQAVASTTDPTALEVAYLNNGNLSRIQQSA
ncbi:MAG: flagellar hook-associated protein FlgK, partial [Pseudomonadota bacterium]